MGVNTDEEKKLFIRQVNVYAAYLAYTDHNWRLYAPFAAAEEVQRILSAKLGARRCGLGVFGK